VATRRVSKNRQDERSGGNVTGYRGDNTSQKNQETPYNFDPVAFFANRFWGWPLHGVAINEALPIVYILEIKQSTEIYEGFPEVKEAEHKSIIRALRAAALKW